MVMVSRCLLGEAEVRVGVAVAALVEPALAFLSRKVFVLSVQADEVRPLNQVEDNGNRDEGDRDLGARFVARRVGRDVDAAVV